MANDTQPELSALDHITTAMTKTAIIDRSEAHKLTAFQDCLPDANSELFYHEDLVFTKFTELPLELRLHIWRDTFPEDTRKFKIDSRIAQLAAGPNPISLRVHHESRSETLRYYKVLLEHKNGFKRYYNPVIDRVLVYHWFPFWHESAKSRFVGWKWQGGDTAKFVDLGEFWYRKVYWNSQITRMSKLEGLGRIFQRLQKLDVYISNIYPGDWLEDVKSLRKCYKSIDEEFIRGEDSREDGYRLPDINIVGHPRR